MSVCAVVDVNGFVKATNEQICSEFLLLTQSEFDSSSVAQILSTLESLFGFDLATFGIVHGSMMLAFLGGHFTGRMVKYLGARS
ncbi:MAG: hypothetical protein COA59_15575 [Colwellia sp.]|jgi:hypothetical protein|nr:MAG: hypothetical protein COA59_15575 [Colwellia sp.]